MLSRETNATRLSSQVLHQLYFCDLGTGMLIDSHSYSTVYDIFQLQLQLFFTFFSITSSLNRDLDKWFFTYVEREKDLNIFSARIHSRHIVQSLSARFWSTTWRIIPGLASG